MWKSLWRVYRSSDRLPAFQRLRTWFTNHASATSVTRRELLTWQPLLQRLHQIRNPRPRCRSAAQQYMLEYPDEVSAALVTRRANNTKLSNPQLMNLRNQVAKSLLLSKDSNFTKQLEDRAAAQHELALKEWDLILEDISAAEDVSQCALFLFFYFLRSLVH